MSRRIIICDLDDTLVDPSQRAGLTPPPALRNDTSAWVPYNKACLDDAPIWSTITVMRALQAAGFLVYIVTSRCKDALAETQEQLKNVCLAPDRLIMREMGDCRSSADFKRAVLTVIGPENVLCAYDDQCSVIEMMRELGITAYQVARHLAPGIHQC